MENPQLAQLTQFFKLQSKAFSIFFVCRKAQLVLNVNCKVLLRQTCKKNPIKPWLAISSSFIFIGLECHCAFKIHSVLFCNHHDVIVMHFRSFPFQWRNVWLCAYSLTWLFIHIRLLLAILRTYFVVSIYNRFILRLLLHRRRLYVSSLRFLGRKLEVFFSSSSSSTSSTTRSMIVLLVELYGAVSNSIPRYSHIPKEAF